MSDKVQVSPTPIQRNVRDVATDLTKLFFELRTPQSSDEIGEVYAKFFALASFCDYKSVEDLQKLLPESVIETVGAYKHVSYL